MGLGRSGKGIAPLPEIVQIVPAQGYVAVYRDDDGGLITEPVAVWALVRHTEAGGSWNAAEGLEANSGGLYRCEEATNFLGYAVAATFRPEAWERAYKPELMDGEAGR